ncbi:MAG: glycosyltransferase family 4 protein, partial [Acidimicrobiia bacterium]|nr:glycosyltransferase family 4 protein [Acidimicrobiia bacterium]
MNRETDPVDACRGRVLVVASELPPGPGGIGTHAHQLSVALDELGFDVALLGSQHYAAPAEQKRFRESSPIAISRLPDGPNPLVTARRRLSALRRALSAHRPDVVIASGGRVLWFAVPASVRAGVPVVSVIHGSELGGPAWQRRLTRRVIEQSDRVVAVSAFTAGLIREMAAHVDATVIPNGADGTRFAPDPSRRQRFRERWGLGDRPVVLTVGNLTERKGQRKVIEALPAVAESVPDVAYVLVGAPTDREDMAARAAELGVSDRLFITGQLDSDEVTDAYAAADLFAMTSTSTSSGDVEGFGIAVVEAALSGIPAVVAAGTGAAEAVIDGRTGLVSSTEATPLATALASLLTDGRRRVSMGREANLCARSSGTWRHRAADYGEILDELVAAKRKPRIVVISHTEHYRATDGSIVAFGPTTREIDHLATLASELVHVAPLHGGPPP